MTIARIPRCPKCLRVLARGDWRKEEPTAGTNVIWRFCPSHDPDVQRQEAELRAQMRRGYGPAPEGTDPFAGFREGE